ncbi:MAG TPA: TonB-dependent receptor [Chthoniobacterales bacterium]|nr:TonB-dependent receptor [Chthoniobacterales bacterium]
MTRIKSGYLRAVAVATAVQSLLLFGLQLSAQAQTESPAPASDQASSGGDIQQVTVTGYLIPHIGEGPQSVTSYDQAQMQKTGYQTLADILQSLPQATGNFNPGVTSGFGFSPGGASISLKGLPPNDTLVLVDGLRMPSYPFPQVSTAATINYVDINSIPTGAVDRVDFLNDGGSATYGTDAVAGVVNFILKDQYTGGDVYNYFGISQRGDDETYHGSFTGGLTQKFSDTSSLSIVAVFDYLSQGPILGKDRANTTQELSTLSFKFPNHPLFPSPTGQFVNETTGAFIQTKQGFNGVNPTVNNFVSTPFDQFSLNGLEIQPRESRLGGTVKLTYNVTDWLKLYDSFLISRTEETSSFGPNQGIYPPPFNAGVVVPANNPFNPFHAPLQVQSLALNEFGVLNTDTTITTFREVIGGTVQLPNGWFLDANFLYGESDGTETMKNLFTFNGIQEALSGTLPGNVGQFFNPFADELAAGPNSAFHNNKNLITSIFENIRSDIMQFHTVLGGTLYDLPSGAVTVAGGFEYRSEDYIVNEDPNSKSGNLAAIQFPATENPTNARRSIWSIFGEANIPILGGAWSWPGLRSLQLTVSERQDYYSDFGSTAKPKFAILYKPIDDFTVQASYSESFVAPSLPELFTTALPAETSIIDPKSRGAGALTVLNSTTGNPNLKPENSYMYYVRGIWTPGSSDPDHSWWGWAKGFSAYVDWYQLDQHNVVGTLTPQEVVDLGNGVVPGNGFVRGASGLITSVFNTYENLGNTRSEGIDFGFNYTSKEYNWGKIELSFDGTYIYGNTASVVQGLNPRGSFFFRVFDETDLANTVGPDLKFNASVFYSKTLFGIDTFRTGATLYYVGSELDFNNTDNGTNPAANAGLDFPGFIHTIGSWTTLNWQISYQFGKPTEIIPQTPKAGYDKEGKKIVGEKAIAPVAEGPRSGWRELLANTTITFGINNIFDTAPPLAVDNVSGFPSNFDTASGVNYYQRFFWLSIDKKF